MKTNITVPENVQKAIDVLNSNGFKAYIVGGCVRDSILGKTPDDYDLTTNATPEEMEQCFKDYRVIETGIKHGTLTVIINHTLMEITTHRIDGEYTDNRRPNSVSFSRRLTDDLSRRDFTVNAMAYNNEVGLVDEFGGMNDLKAGVIKAVGDPDKRFEEDALRIIRALRFASVLGFKTETETAKAVMRNKELLRNIAPERIFTEFSKLICGNCADILMMYRDVFAVFIPEITPLFDLCQNNKYHIYDAWEHTVKSVEYIENELDLRLTMFFHDIGKGRFDGKNGHFYGHAEYSRKIAFDTLKRLRCDNNTINTVCTLVKYHDTPIEANKKIIKRRLNALGTENLKKLLKVKRADILAQSPEYRARLNELDEVEKICNEIISQEQCFRLKDLAVNGKDIMSLGISGKAVGETLDKLLNLVIDERLENNKDELLNYVKNI